MRAAIIEQLSETPRVAEVPDPVRGSGQALVQVSAAALNPLDISVWSGRFYAGPPELPYVPGCEAVGTVVEGEGLRPGQRVRLSRQAGYEGQGCLAELVAVDESTVMGVDADVPDAMAAALGVAGLAGWLSVTWRADVQAGERVLVLGATGPVGQVAVQAARVRGAGRVVAGGRDSATLERTRGLGADQVVELTSDDPDELAHRYREAAGGDLDVTIDPLWGTPALAAARATAVGGRLINLGQSAGAEVTLPSGLVRGRMLAVLGYSNLALPHEQLTAAYSEMLRRTAGGELRLDYLTLPLDAVARAWEMQARSPHRKLVVEPGAAPAV